jgi:hypothetical protein
MGACGCPRQPPWDWACARSGGMDVARPRARTSNAADAMHMHTYLPYVPARTGGVRRAVLCAVRCARARNHGAARTATGMRARAPAMHTRTARTLPAAPAIQSTHPCVRMRAGMLPLVLAIAVAGVVAMPAALGLMAYPLALRKSARDAYLEARGALRAQPAATTESLLRLAVEHFKARHPAVRISRPREFIVRWAARADSAPDGALKDAPGRGRKRVLSHARAMRCADILASGGWPSVEDAIADNAQLRAAARLYRSPAAFWRRLKQADPKLQSRMLRVKQDLTPQQRGERVAACQLLLRMSQRVLMDYLLRTFWIDMKTMVISVRTGRVICRRGDAVVLTTPLITWQKQHYVVIKFYAVVNALAGAVLYREVTGTTGLSQRHAWKVRARCGYTYERVRRSVGARTCNIAHMNSSHSCTSFQCRRSML